MLGPENISVVLECEEFGVLPDNESGGETQAHLAQVYCECGRGLFPLANQELAATWKENGVACLQLDRRLEC